MRDPAKQQQRGRWGSHAAGCAGVRQRGLFAEQRGGLWCTAAQAERLNRMAVDVLDTCSQTGDVVRDLVRSAVTVGTCVDDHGQQQR
jgi:hypothetical protein